MTVERIRLHLPASEEWFWESETFLFFAMKAWEQTLPDNYFTTDPRTESDTAMDFGSFLVEQKRELQALYRKWKTHGTT